MDKVKKIEIAKNYCKKYPTTSTKALAEMMYANDKLIFNSVEHARTTIRHVRGQSGDVNRKKFKDSYVPKMPKSYAEEPVYFKLPVADNNILMISDLHIPYQTNEAVETALNYGLENKVNTIFINGDLIDFHGMSRYEKDPRKRSIKQEFDAVEEFLDYLRHKFPTQNIYWLKGNHDKRYEHWLMSKAPMLFEDEYYLLEDRLRLYERRIKIIDDSTLVKIGKLFVTHGHLLLKGVFAPVNAARGVFIRAKESCIIGHVHKVSEHQETTLNGRVIVSYSTGCLCELSPGYSPFANNYIHGFAHIKTESNGEFHVRNFKIIKGKIY